MANTADESRKTGGTATMHFGVDEEYAIHDYEAPFCIGEYDNVYQINNIAAVLSKYDSRVVVALSECLDNVDEVVRQLENGDFSVYFDVNSLCDVAANMVDECYFGPIPPSLASYIDNEQIARDLKMDGWYMHHELRIAIRPHS
ncbi:antirestriction protein ArdA [Brevibacillus agri]|nr:antirestriction protein ArdA [Brevibacillus agri]MED1646105.1 antirestriction protein ArdA [Brevibacillus agri]MED1653059.1 antirestriction protein ArdA [Brevibacillus agri]MED1685791.1 antirestriction protein ArdA [Brevibacillus agri]MED1694967.1 antirestriction protein ArdA [Brevibacillus agri]MED1700089.1 antirestriction protein ArdA [Brevibacillus agri]